MAGDVPAAGCGCVSASAVFCCVADCALSACLECALEGRDDAFVGEGPLGPSVDGPQCVFGFEPFTLCAGADCGNWLCAEHLEIEDVCVCEGCKRAFCPDCPLFSVDCVDRCSRDPACCSDCEEKFYGTCCECGRFLCEKCSQQTCECCGGNICSRCHGNSSECCRDNCFATSGNVCAVCVKDQCEPYVDCSLCDNKLCDACVQDGSKLMEACKDCKITICRGRECSKNCPLCRKRCCIKCLSWAECCGRSLCTSCTAGSRCCSSGCGKLVCQGCSAKHASMECAKRSKTGE
jgi:hypothetical protein